MMRLKKSDVNEEEVRNDLKDLLYKVPSVYYVSKKNWVGGWIQKIIFLQTNFGTFDHFLHLHPGVSVVSKLCS